MKAQPDELAIALLVFTFLALGLYLLNYSRHRTKMLETFAKGQHLPLRPSQEPAVQEILDRCFSLKSDGLVRSFGQLSSLVGGEPIWVFRTVELLDLNPYAQSDLSHFPRIVALFQIPPTLDAFFILNHGLPARSSLPEAAPPPAPLVAVTRQILKKCHARHPLSLTFANGYGLIYWEPFVTGSENLHDIECLYCVARNLDGELNRGR